MKITSIKTAEPFEDLFPIELPVSQAVTKDMQKNGFDPIFLVTI